MSKHDGVLGREFVDDMLDTRNRLFLADKLLYAVAEQVTPGTVLQIKEGPINYQYFLFHSEEDAQQIATKTGTTLLHVRDAPRIPIGKMIKAWSFGTASPGKEHKR